MQVAIWALTGLSIFGVILNLYKSKWGFACWICSNACWCFIDFYYKIYGQAFLFLVYFILAIIGFYKWNKQPKKEE